MSNLINKIEENDKVKLIILGTQSPFCNENNACPSYLIIYKNTKILLDCGSGSHRFFDMDNLSGLNIFISHLHRDHYNDIFNYKYAFYVLNNQNRIKKDMKIYLPDFPKEIYNDIIREDYDKIKYFAIKEDKECEIDDCKISFCKVKHSKDVETFAIKVKINKKTIVYSADISFKSKNKFVDFAKNADLLLCESSLLTRHNFPKICNHLTALQAGIIAKESNAKKLVLTHLWPEIKVEEYLKEAKKVFNCVYIAKEKDVYFI